SQRGRPQRVQVKPVPPRTWHHQLSRPLAAERTRLSESRSRIAKAQKRVKPARAQSPRGSKLPEPNGVYVFVPEVALRDRRRMKHRTAPEKLTGTVRLSQHRREPKRVHALREKTALSRAVWHTVNGQLSTSGRPHLK